jgi:A/G-specific adenine glycosylase
LLTWYDSNKRTLPWRNENAVPYRVWLSEIMLQQTTVPTVISYFDAFVARWPKIENLADCELDEVLHAWQGLGYYARARNLHKCAKVIATEFNGEFPSSEAELLTLPGIGPYTAAAISAIAFQQPSVPVDGNIERVISRLHALDDPVSAVKTRIADLARMMLPPSRPGDFAQAMMDLGSMVCRPKAADCAGCPLRSGCKSGPSGDWSRFPVKRPKPVKPTRHGIVFWLVREDGGVFLRRRPDKGLLGGMIEVPSTEWRTEEWSLLDASSLSPAAADWQPVPGIVTHTFTHFHLRLSIVLGKVTGAGPNDGFWSMPDAFGDHALPTVMKKVIRHVMRDLGQSS